MTEEIERERVRGTINSGNGVWLGGAMKGGTLQILNHWIVLIGTLFVMLLSGCGSEHFTGGRGDLGSFIVQQAVERGAAPRMTNGLAMLNGSWRYRTDSHGIQIHLPREDYSELLKFCEQLLGTPGFGPTLCTDGSTMGGYRLSKKGGGLMFVQDSNFCEVIILRPATEIEAMNAQVRAAAKAGMQKTN